jgi:predicted adenine nucleotide alpha hydrolase (AANH) superfamily ATPase
MKLLMHICCANCCLYPLKHLGSKGIEIRGLWYNPNIHPEAEYEKRLAALRSLEGLRGLDIEYIGHYGIVDYLRAINGKDRCSVCYLIRLEETAKTANRMGLDGFTTSLLVSPYQRFDLIVEAGRQMGKKHSIAFYAEDMRAGWRQGVDESKKLGLYRQKYCGCIYSGIERGIIPSSKTMTEAPALNGGTALGIDYGIRA